MSIYRPTIYGVGTVAAATVNGNFTGIRSGVNEIELTEIPDDAAFSNDKFAVSRGRLTLPAFAFDGLGVPFPDMIHLWSSQMPVGGRIEFCDGSTIAPQFMEVQVEALRPTSTGRLGIVSSDTAPLLNFYQHLECDVAFRAGDTLRVSVALAFANSGQFTLTGRTRAT